MGGANRPLIECQRQWERQPSPKDLGVYRREPGWRPLNPAVDRIEEPVLGVDYGMTYPDDPTAYYYWRRSPTGE
jgi:hypothetical protein